MKGIKFKKLKKSAFKPTRATDGSAGYDLKVPEDTIIRFGRQVVPLYIAAAVPDWFYADIRTRSGFACKGMEDKDGERKDADVIHGVVDSDYRGGIGVIVNSHEKYPFTIARGTKIAQMLICPYCVVEFEEVDELDTTDRNGGFGSTGSR